MTEETRVGKRSFLYVVRYDIAHIRDHLERLLQLDEEYAIDGSPRIWNIARAHPNNALRDVEERRNHIRRNLSQIRDLTQKDPSLEPESLALTVINGSRDVLQLASRIEAPEFGQPERHDMVSDASREIQTLNSEIERLNAEIMKNQ